MTKEVEPWVRSAQADFQAAGHRGASLADLHTMCLQIEDMVQSIALGLNEMTQVLCSLKDQIDRMEQTMSRERCE
jgi:hypothetical protein